MENKSTIDKPKEVIKSSRHDDLADLLQLNVETLKSNGVPKPYTSPNPSPYDSFIESNRERSDAKLTGQNDTSAEDEALAFYGQRDPQIQIQSEKPHHRVMLYLAAEGNTATEIAEKTGFTTVTVNNLLKQPWAAKRIAQILEESGRTKVELVLTGAALGAVKRLITEMDSTSGTAATRINAADKVLDRCWGKPNQPITHKEGKSLDDMSDSEIAAELARIKGQRNS